MCVVYFIHFYYLEIYFDKNFSVKYSKQFRKIMGNIFVTSAGLGGGNTCFSQCYITTSKEPIFFLPRYQYCKIYFKIFGSMAAKFGVTVWEVRQNHGKIFLGIRRRYVRYV